MNENEKLAKAVLLFLRGGPWTKDDQANWKEYTGSMIATTRTLCDMARRVLSEQPNSAGEVRVLSAFEQGKPPEARRYGTVLYHSSATPGSFRPMESGGDLGSENQRGGHDRPADDGPEAELPNSDHGGQTPAS